MILSLLTKRRLKGKRSELRVLFEVRSDGQLDTVCLNSVTSVAPGSDIVNRFIYFEFLENLKTFRSNFFFSFFELYFNRVSITWIYIQILEAESSFSNHWQATYADICKNCLGEHRFWEKLASSGDVGAKNSAAFGFFIWIVARFWEELESKGDNCGVNFFLRIVF